MQPNRSHLLTVPGPKAELRLCDSLWLTPRLSLSSRSRRCALDLEASDRGGGVTAASGLLIDLGYGEEGRSEVNALNDSGTGSETRSSWIIASSLFTGEEARIQADMRSSCLCGCLSVSGLPAPSRLLRQSRCRCKLESEPASQDWI